MQYIQESLLRDEKLIYASRPHWIVFGPAVMTFVLAALVWYYLPQYVGTSQPVWHGYTFSTLASLFVFAVGVLSFVRAFIFFTTSEYGITNRRVIMKTGWIRRNSIEIFLQRLEAVNVDQTALGRIFGYGTVVVIGTGGTQDYYSNVPAPVKFRRYVQSGMNALMEEGGRERVASGKD